MKTFTCVLCTLGKYSTFQQQTTVNNNKKSIHQHFRCFHFNLNELEIIFSSLYYHSLKMYKKTHTPDMKYDSISILFKCHFN